MGGVKPPIHFIAYYMQKGGRWVQIACKIAYVLNGRPLANNLQNRSSISFSESFPHHLFKLTGDMRIPDHGSL